jgi:hypothetical protein
MSHENGDRTPADLMRVAERLREERVTATPLELDELKQRARRQAIRRHRPQRGALMKSRLALTMLIVVGAMMSGTGATLAITGSSGSDNASENQYTTPTTETVTTETTTTETVTTETVPTTPTTPTTETTPTETEPVLGPDVQGTEEEGDELPAQEDNGDGDGDDSQPEQQVAAAGDSSDSLPFTGFLAIPLMIGGVALVATGAVLRRKSE